MQKLAMQEPNALSGMSIPLSLECWFDDSSISEMDYFIETLSSLKGNEASPNLIGSIITHYASKWLPELANGEEARNAISTRSEDSPKSVTATWMKKKFFIETIIGILPPEKDSIPCDFLLRLLRAANMVGVGPAYRDEVEKRVACQLDQALLRELMIPSFSHDCDTLLDVELVLRLVRRFVSCEDVSCRTGVGLTKVAKLVDGYLAEAAVDSHLKLNEFFALANVLPSHTRSMHDGLYRAIDTYLKVHPGLSKQERNKLCNLIDSRKLSADACIHAAQNERLPVRAVIQVLLSEQTKLYNHVGWSGSVSGKYTMDTGLDYPGRCNSKRGMNAQQIEIQRLKDDVLMLQSQCMNMEIAIEKLLMEKKKGFFDWKKIGIPGFKTSYKFGQVERENEATAVRGRTCRKSLS